LKSLFSCDSEDGSTMMCIGRTHTDTYGVIELDATTGLIGNAWEFETCLYGEADSYKIEVFTSNGESFIRYLDSSGRGCLLKVSSGSSKCFGTAGDDYTGLFTFGEMDPNQIVAGGSIIDSGNSQGILMTFDEFLNPLITLTKDGLHSVTAVLSLNSSIFASMD